MNYENIYKGAFRMCEVLNDGPKPDHLYWAVSNDDRGYPQIVLMDTSGTTLSMYICEPIGESFYWRRAYDM